MVASTWLLRKWLSSSLPLPTLITMWSFWNSDWETWMPGCWLTVGAVTSLSTLAPPPLSSTPPHFLFHSPPPLPLFYTAPISFPPLLLYLRPFLYTSTSFTFIPSPLPLLIHLPPSPFLLLFPSPFFFAFYASSASTSFSPPPLSLTHSTLGPWGLSPADCSHSIQIRWMRDLQFPSCPLLPPLQVGLRWEGPEQPPCCCQMCSRQTSPQTWQAGKPGKLIPDCTGLGMGLRQIHILQYKDTSKCCLI